MSCPGVLGSSGASWAEVSPVAEGLPHVQETLGSILSLGVGRIFMNYCLDVMLNRTVAFKQMTAMVAPPFLLRPASMLRTQRLKLYGFIFFVPCHRS